MRKKSVADALLRSERKKKKTGRGSYLTRGDVSGTYKTKLRFQPLHFARDFISILILIFLCENIFRDIVGKIVLS